LDYFPGYTPGMRGRKPTPTRLKALHGNPGKRPLNTCEPTPPAALPACPDHLDEAARAEWARLVPELAALGLLTDLDRAALAGYCACWSRVVKLESTVQRLGEALTRKTWERGPPSEHNPKGWHEVLEVRVNPYYTALTHALRELRGWAAEFGLTPSSRSRIHTQPADQADALETYLAASAN